MNLSLFNFSKWTLLVGVMGVALTLASAVLAQDAVSGQETDTADASEGALTPDTEAAAADEEAAAADEEAAVAETKLADMTSEELTAKLAELYLLADGEGLAVSTIYGDADTLWTCLAAFLVFFMQAGFALVECGFTRAKNACNIIMKNAMDFSLGTMLFWFVGFGFMFGTTNGWIGTSNFFYEGVSGFDWAFLLFQTVFCATAATIVSGAMAERTKFTSYLIYTVAITVFVYPIYGGWAWGSLVGDTGAGWLEGGGAPIAWTGKGFIDFAGSTVVHSIGGWCALAGAIVIGPRIGKYSKDGKVNPIPGHNIPLAALGVFILWLGWFGFNPGSTTAIGEGSFAKVAVATNLAAAAGAISAMITSWIAFKKPDPSFTLNGALAGLVAITAGCANLEMPMATLTGLIGGVLVVLAVVFFDRLKIDDPVGAISVHGVCGLWGTLAVGLFMPVDGLLMGGGAMQFMAQVVGAGAAFLWAFPVSLVIFLALKFSPLGLRVSAEEEVEGLDITEHGMHAYPPSLISEGLAGTAPVPAGAYSSSSVAQPATEA
ncbi:ammonium transporter [Lignipirellula cremea]|uniref:Ammonium transporter n=1 Tax=Lignipirellula cremea TaxID=2528010 RepID=A0A518DT20_9BACT|nr:ammonium transporter [Lignipirellula cremea]QDU94973.1 Ammonia channel precursor [Lignipirellula cremea]